MNDKRLHAYEILDTQLLTLLTLLKLVVKIANESSSKMKVYDSSTETLETLFLLGKGEGEAPRSFWLFHFAAQL